MQYIVLKNANYFCNILYMTDNQKDGYKIF